MNQREVNEPEEELAVEVTDVDGVHVDKTQVPHTHQRLKKRERIKRNSR